MKSRSARLIIVGLAVLAIVATLMASLMPVPTTYNLNVSTQVLRVVIGGGHRVDWHLTDALTYRGYAAGGQPFAGTVRVMPGTDVTFERTDKGPLRISFVSENRSEPIAQLSAARTKPELVYQRLVVAIPAKVLRSEEGYAAVLPMTGKVTLGAELAQYGGERPSLLLGGKIALLAHSLLGDQKFEAGTAELDIGDFVQIEDDAEAHGVLLVGSKSDMTAVFRVVARRLDVYRFGAQGYAVYASALTRIKNDTTLQLLWALSVFLVGGLTNWMRRWQS